MPTYKLTYFNVKALAEPTRYIFALSGIEYEDIRLTDEEWKKQKALAPLNQIPILEVDGVVIHQSQAIHQFMAEETGLLGTNSMERAKIFTIVESCRDLDKTIWDAHFEKDADKKKKLDKELHDTVIPKYAGFFESELARNGDSDWFVAKKVSLADVMVYNTFTDHPGLGLDALKTDAFANFAKLRGFAERFQEIPQIKAWIQNRPQTEL